MRAIIKEIEIPNSSYSFISNNGKEGNLLKNLSKINIFVGENNSGKSRFLRSIVKKEDFRFLLYNNDFDKINENIDLLKIRFDSFNNGFDVNIYDNIQDFEDKLNKIEKVDLLVNKGNYLQSILDLKSLFEQFSDDEHIIGKYTTRESRGFNSFDSVSYKWTGEKLIEIMRETFNLDKPLEDVILDYQFNKLYIPILRGLRPLLAGRDYNDLYKDRTRDDHFSEYAFDTLKKMNVDLFTGLDAYDTVDHYSRFTYETKKLLKEFKIYLKDNFFDGKRVEITASLDKNRQRDVLSIKIGDEHEKPIHELGDGIQSIIILTLQLFLRKNENLLIFIEEPEQYLHPGLQRKLIETFLNEEGFENFQFFFTTHSNHFLDITLDFEDISIFTVKKELDNSDNEEKVPSFVIENLSEGDTSALELLGVRNSSVFLTNCTIWIEGITDRHYLRHYLKLYADKHIDDPDFEDFKEDYHYSFVEYGGNNITHWSFLDKEDKPINVKKLCGRLFLIADKDQRKEERHEQLKKTLKERYHPLKCREIENLVSPEVLLKIVKEYEGLREDESSDNINEDFIYADYKNNLLGRFIEEKIIVNIEDMERKSYKMKSGTIKNKDSFLKKATKYIQKWDDLSPEAQEITGKIYDFIKEYNPK